MKFTTKIVSLTIGIIILSGLFFAMYQNSYINNQNPNPTGTPLPNSSHHSGTLTQVQTPQFYPDGVMIPVPIIWGIITDQASNVNLPYGTILYLVNNFNVTSYSDFITDPNSIANGMTITENTHVIDFTGEIVSFHDIKGVIHYGLVGHIAQPQPIAM